MTELKPKMDCLKPIIARSIMKRNFLFLMIILLPAFLLAQQATITGTIAGLADATIKITDFYGNENRLIDSVKTNAAGRFSFSFSQQQPTGLYRLRWNERDYLDIIFDRQPVVFKTDAGALIDSLEFIKSVQNQLYYQYLNLRNMTQFKLELIEPVLKYYPADSSGFYNAVRKEHEAVLQQLPELVASIRNNYPQNFATRLIVADYVPPTAESLPPEDQLQYLRAHFFDHVNFEDTSLLYSNIISNKILQYLSLYQNNRLGKDQLQVEFIKAVDRIMAVTSVNQLMYEYALDFLIRGFESYGFDKVNNYIADHISFDDACVNSERKAALEKKVERFKKFAIGEKAPDFTATALDGKKITLSEMKSGYTLLLFWATWCAHCPQLVRDIATIYEPAHNKGLEIIAISLDDDPKKLQTFLSEGNYPWIQIADYQKWQGPLVQQYDVYATPTMLLLFSDQTILARPVNFSELKNVLFERNILH
ncbi:redoxin domain-containing protein [Candidatus Falkowbacteria bacterium]|nr:redoxin domain-containing protein [Candidatus Falkowbacteria bacterium]